MVLSLFKDINGFAFHHDAFEDPMRFFAQDMQWFLLALLAVLFFAWGDRRSLSGRHGVAAAGFAALLALGIAQVIAGIVDRSRPFVAHPQAAHLFIPPSTDP